MSAAFNTQAISLVGGRELNEDAHGSAIGTVSAIAVVCDGLGGHRAGDVAARTLVEVLLDQARQARCGECEPAEALLNELLVNAYAEFVRRMKSLDVGDSQTTFALVWLSRRRVLAAHVGDSRVVGVGDRGVLWRTRDHSVVQMLVDSGEIDESEMGNHPDQGKLLRSVAIGRGFEPSVRAFPALAAGQAVVLCSDGFWEYLEKSEWQLLAANAQPLSDLVRMGVERAGPQADNATAIWLAVAPGVAASTRRRSRLGAFALAAAGVAGIAAALMWWTRCDGPCPAITPEPNATSESRWPSQNEPPPTVADPAPVHGDAAHPHTAPEHAEPWRLPSIQADPSDARIEFVDPSLGPYRADTIFPRGDYRIRLSHPGYLDQEIIVSAETTGTYMVRMTPRPPARTPPVVASAPAPESLPEPPPEPLPPTSAEYDEHALPDRPVRPSRGRACPASIRVRLPNMEALRLSWYPLESSTGEKGIYLSQPLSQSQLHRLGADRSNRGVVMKNELAPLLDRLHHLSGYPLSLPSMDEVQTIHQGNPSNVPFSFWLLYCDHHGKQCNPEGFGDPSAQGGSYPLVLALSCQDWRGG